MSAKTLKQNNRFTHHYGHMKWGKFVMESTVQYKDRCTVTLQQPE